MKLIFILAIDLIKVFLINFLQVVKIVRALGIYTFVNYEELAFLLLYKGMRRVRSFEMEL